MIQLADFSVNFGSQSLFEHCSLAIPDGKHLGLVGQNGSGKSTLLKLIAGLTEPTSGQVVIPKGMKVAYLPQEIVYNKASTPLLKEVLTVFKHVFDVEQEMRELEISISESSTPELLMEYDRLLETFHRLDGYQIEARAKEILSGLGFKEEDYSRPVSDFSGGWYMRIALAKILLEEPDCLLLDEPTNHLDMETLVWLEGMLSGYRGVLILVSHDRYFLDKLIDGIIEIEKGNISSYSGNYTDYEIQKEQRMEHELAIYKNQKRKIVHMEQFIERFRYKASKARQVQSRVKQLSKIDVRKIDYSTRKIKFSFSACERSGDPVVSAQQLAFSYDTMTVFNQSDFDIRRAEKVALVGPNGAGKTTLMKLICGYLTPQSGTLKLGYNLTIGYFAQHHVDQLDASKTVLDEIWSAAPQLPQTEVRSLLGRFLFSGDDIDKPIAVLSGGEKSRVVLIKLLLSKANFLILDEPTNHLDMQSKEILASALDDFQGSVLIVSHDRFFLDMLVTKIIHFKNMHAKEFLGNYSEYEEKFLKDITPSSATRNEKEIKPNKKNRKRREAEERTARYHALKGAREEIQILDKRIIELENRKNELNKLFLSPEFKELSVEEMFQCSTEHKNVMTELGNCEERWLELHEQLENN